MEQVARIIIAILVFLTATVFLNLLTSFLLSDATIMFGYLITYPLAFLAARFVWVRLEEGGGLFASIALWSCVIGAIGFMGGFVGPMIFAPGANQGPMLGIFITGPAGFVLGALGGAIWWWLKHRHQRNAE